jgi:hypothetical protein
MTATLISRLGFAGVSMLLAYRMANTRAFYVSLDKIKAETMFRQISMLNVVACVVAVLAIVAAASWIGRVDRSASALGKFHDRTSTVVLFAPLLLLPLFYANDRVQFLQVGDRSPLDLRPALVGIVMCAVMWLPYSRLKAAAHSLGEQLPIRIIGLLDVIAVGCFWAAWSRTSLAPIDRYTKPDVSRMGFLLAAAAAISLLATALLGVAMTRIRRAIGGRVRAAARPELVDVAPPFVAEQARVPLGPESTRPMMPLAPWRWALLAAYGLWVATMVGAAAVYLQIRGLFDSHASEAQIGHKLLLSTIISLSGFAAVYVTQWAWIIVTVGNANRATVRAPSNVTPWIMALAPVAIAASGLLIGGTNGTALLILAVVACAFSYYASFRTARNAVTSVGGTRISVRSWSLPVSMLLVIQYAANNVRPPTPQQVVLLVGATTLVKAAFIIVAAKAAARVTAEVDASMRGFHQVRRVS